MTLPSPRKAHQDGDIEWIHRVGRGLLGNEPGLGKSRSAIEAFDGGRNLVVAPSLVITGGTWADEIEKWSNHPDRWQVVPYSMLNARSGSRPLQQLRPEVSGRYDALVLDEAHYTKGRQTSWTWASQQIAERSGSLLEMTGTPIPNWSHELFTLLQMIYPDEAKPGAQFGSFWRWAQRWFDCSPTRHSQGAPVAGELLGCLRAGPGGWDTSVCDARPSSDPCEHYREFTDANLGERFRRMLRDECLDLPPITTQVVQTPMDAEQRRVYRALKKDYLATLGDGTELVAWSQGALNVMLDRATTAVGDHGAKLDQLQYDLAARSRPTLVLAHYRSSVEACARVARSVGASAAVVHGGVSKKDKAAAVARFKAGRLDVLVGSLETLAEGLTLTVADMAIFVEMSYKPSRNEQARYRVHRLGQDRPVTIREYLTPKTVDAKKRRLLETKTDRQMRYLTAAQFRALL